MWKVNLSSNDAIYKAMELMQEVATNREVALLENLNSQIIKICVFLA